MDIRQLRYFIAIADAGSLSRASERLFIAQSALSHHVAALETELSRQLFLRTASGVVLTAAGRTLYQHAQVVLKQLEQAKADVTALEGEVSGTVTLGLPESVSEVVFVALLKTITRDYPRLMLHFVYGTSHILRERLDSGRLDLAALYMPEKEKGIRVKKLYDEDLYFVTKQPLGPGSVSVETICTHPLLLPSAGHGIRLAFEAACLSSGSAFRIVAEIDGMKQALDAVEAGVGATIVPGLPKGHPLQAGLNFYRIDDPHFSRSVSLCWSETAIGSAAREAVASAVLSVCQNITTK